MDWDRDSRRCYAKLLVFYAALVIISVLAYVVRFFDVLTLLFAAFSILGIVLITTAYMILRNPPLEYPELTE